MTQFRKGDVVMLKATVDSEYEIDGSIRVRVEPYHEFYAAVTAMTMVSPMIKVGDSVQHDGDPTGVVLAISEGWHFVKCDDGTGCECWNISMLKRLDPPKPVEPELFEVEEAPNMGPVGVV